MVIFRPLEVTTAERSVRLFVTMRAPPLDLSSCRHNVLLSIFKEFFDRSMKKRADLALRSDLKRVCAFFPKAVQDRRSASLFMRVSESEIWTRDFFSFPLHKHSPYESLRTT